MKYIFFIASLLTSTFAFSQEASTESKDGLKDWSLGFGLGVEQYRNQYIDSARLQGETRIVVTEQTYNTRPSAWLTMNWNVWGLGQNTASAAQKAAGNNDVYNTKFGFFAGVQLVGTNSEAFSSFALGPQVSFLTASGKTISVGLGWVTHGTKYFANGISEGQPLPKQYDDIVYEKGTENSYMLMMSVGI